MKFYSTRGLAFETDATDGNGKPLLVNDIIFLITTPSVIATIWLADDEMYRVSRQ